MGAENEALRARAAAAKAEVAHHKGLLSQAEAHLASLQKELDAISYPISTLPLEVTVMIFTHCVPASGPALHYLSADVAPRLLTHVCRRWRHIVLSTPTLWAKIYINLHAAHNEAEFEEYVKRAAAVPLHVAVRGMTSMAPDDEEAEPTVLLPAALAEHVEMLGRHCSKIRRLRVDVCPEIADAMDVELCEPSVPQFDALETLEMVGMGSDLFDPPMRMFSCAPRLVHATGSGLSPMGLVLPWAQLEHYSGSVGPSPAACTRFLECLPNLRRLDLFCAAMARIDEVVELEVPSQRFIHPNIETLATDATFDILSFLTLPALKSLEIKRWPASAASVATIPPFVQRSTVLATLRIHCPTSIPAAGDLTDIFKRTPGLDRLELQSPSRESFDNLFAALSESAGVLPSLTSLAIINACSTSAWVFTDMMLVLVAAIRKRQSFQQPPPTMPLRSISMEVRRMQSYFWPRQSDLKKRAESMTLPDEDLAFLQQLRQQGTVLKLGTVTVHGRKYIPFAF
uniref:F-box domain-containing protein n=1 Tax=Mycena chlorophos TaxID=658473 RepID=A0ABQ0M6J5_MYCCL|nr:predicted protein [Mycena chlorophos]